jgi:hypothetical protein
MKLLITGDRNWNNRQLIYVWLKKLKALGYDQLIEGEARGADTIAKEEALKLGYTLLNRNEKTVGWPALWDDFKRMYPIEDYGMKWKSAGTERNIEMLNKGNPDLVLAFHPDLSKSKGTKHMVNISKLKNKKVIHVIDEKHYTETTPITTSKEEIEEIIKNW